MTTSVKIAPFQMISPPTGFPAPRAVGGSSPDNKGLKSCQENRPLDNFPPTDFPALWADGGSSPDNPTENQKVVRRTVPLTTSIRFSCRV